MEEESDEDSVNKPEYTPPHVYQHHPTEVAAKAALDDLRNVLKPPRGNGQGYKTVDVNGWTRERLEHMRTFLYLYTNPESADCGSWLSASLRTAQGQGKGPWFARVLRERTTKYIKDRGSLPANPYGAWKETLLDEDEVFADELRLHLQSLGKYVRALDLVHYLSQPDVQERYGLKKTISLATAKRWMHKLGYRWRHTFKGQYVDGHEREDVVHYRQHVFLPAWEKIQSRTRIWDSDKNEITDQLPAASTATGSSLPQRRVIVWYHDESTFYAHDRRQSRWVHNSESPSPYAKGEGPSLMVADFVSADFGWLQSKDGKESARVLFKAGKTRDGWFASEQILTQFRRAVAIAKAAHPEYDHAYVYDNATTHWKRADDALSARHMPKNIPKVGSNWFVETAQKNEQGQPVFCPHSGKPQKKKIQMASGHFTDGTEQPLYFPEGHARAGVFKGMAVILTERVCILNRYHHHQFRRLNLIGPRLCFSCLLLLVPLLFLVLLSPGSH